MTNDINSQSVTPEDSTDMKSNAPTNEESKKSASTVETSSISNMKPQAESISTTTDGKSYSPVTPHLNASMEEDFKKVIEGAEYVAERVMTTLGAQGASALLESMMRPFHSIVDDGRKVAEAITLDDPYKNLGASVMKEVAMQSDKESQDGTTTSVTLAYALIKNFLNTGQRGVRVKRELEKTLPEVLAAIDAQKKEIGIEDVYQVALTSSNSPEIAQLFADVYKEIGKEGLIELENSHVPSTFYTVSDGVKLRGVGYLGAYCTTEPGRGVYKNPKILISKEKITSIEQIGKIADNLERSGTHELVIYCEEMDMSVANKLAATHINGGFKTAVMVAPSLFKDWLYEDFALLTGATPVDYANGKNFKNLTLNDLGTCEKIIIGKEETRLFGTRDITEHIESLKEQAKADDQLQVRAAWLSTKVAILKIGANSEVELSHKRAKVLDCAGACRLALEGGIVVGAGMSLVNASKVTNNPQIKDALMYPAHKILENAGIEAPESFKENEGVNVLNGEKGNLWDMHIVDPANVVKNSVSAAFSIAGTLLSTKAIMPIPKSIKERAERQMSGMPSY